MALNPAARMTTDALVTALESYCVSRWQKKHAAVLWEQLTVMAQARNVAQVQDQTTGSTSTVADDLAAVEAQVVAQTQPDQNPTTLYRNQLESQAQAQAQAYTTAQAKAQEHMELHLQGDINGLYTQNWEAQKKSTSSTNASFPGSQAWRF